MLCCIQYVITRSPALVGGWLSHYLTLNWINVNELRLWLTKKLDSCQIPEIEFLMLNWLIRRIRIITVLICCSQTSYCRLKSLSVELEKLEDKLKIAEKNTSSLETQRKAAVAHNEQLTKQVLTTVFQLCTSVHVCSYFNNRKQLIWTDTGEGVWSRVGRVS